MASLDRPNSVTLWDKDTEEQISIGVRVIAGSDTPILAVMTVDDPENEYTPTVINDYTMTVDQTLSLILDLVTAVQTAVVNQR